jgi:hypothetical protein
MVAAGAGDHLDVKKGKAQEHFLDGLEDEAKATKPEL